MSKSLTEKKVLKKLGIPDFRHMSKDKVVSFVSMLPRMDPEVAKKALEQFPEFSRTALAITDILKATVERAMESNESSVAVFYAECRSVLEALRAELARDEVTSEDRARIIESMMQVLGLLYQKDSENKQFLSGLAKAATIFGGVALLSLAAVLGIKAGVDWGGE